jgi:muconolactone delta-isomerase
MRYLVVGSEGPGFASPEEAVQLLEDIILPSFDALAKLEAERRILAGGLPVGERAFVFIVEASSNEELDQLLRNIPMWGSLNWEVTPLQSFAGRAAHERDAIKKLKKSMQ